MNNKSKIIILEDDPFFVKPIKYHLQKTGNSVSVIESNVSLEYAIEQIFHEEPDIILCDIYMKPNGFDILRIIKDHSQLRLIPFIFVTASNSLPEKIKAYISGVDDFMTKPIDKDELLAKIGSIMLRQNHLKSAIYLDPLTQIFNRKYFQKELERQIRLHSRHKDKFNLVMMDLDDFKKINDNYGHQCGDNCLVEFATYIQSNIRTTDIFARWGGEEFVLIMERSEKDGARKSVTKLIEEYSNHAFATCDGKDLTVSFSAGISIYPEDGTDAKQLIKIADLGLYKAKEAGKKQIKHI